MYESVIEYAKNYPCSLKYVKRSFTPEQIVQIRQAIVEHIESGQRFDVARDQIIEIVGDKTLGEAIAATEITRVYAEGNTRKWAKDGVWGREWRTARDEYTCPICKELHKNRAKMGEPFILADGRKIMNPPAHAGCRCCIFPVVRPEGVDLSKPIRIPKRKSLHSKAQ
jgi:SPP1 gp7 family putative phage head morphogenesis protein